jgi:hypothetical protein
MAEVRIISATYPVYDPYTKTPEELIKARYPDSSMIYATIEIKTNAATAFEIMNTEIPYKFKYHVAKNDNIEYGYSEYPDKSEQWFSLQFDHWRDSFKKYKEAIELGIDPKSAKYLLPPAILGITFDMMGPIPNWNGWINNYFDSFGEIQEIKKMVNKALFKYFPDSTTYFDE